jgi:hypothetical protein
MIAATAMLSAVTLGPPKLREGGLLPRAQSTQDAHQDAQPRTPPATVAGRVVADETGDPLANARVSIKAASGVGAPVVLSDADGHFVFNVPAGRHSVVASKSRYARQEVTATSG